MENLFHSITRIEITKPGTEVIISGDLNNDSYLILSSHPSDGVLLYGVLTGNEEFGNKFLEIKRNNHLEIINGTKNSKFKIKINTYLWIALYFIPIGFHNKKLNIEIIKPFGKSRYKSNRIL